MLGSLKLQLSNPNCSNFIVFSLRSRSRPFTYYLHLPIPRHKSLTVQSHHDSTSLESSISSEYIASVGYSPPTYSTIQFSQWNLTQRHILMLTVIACSAAISATWLFLSAIPTLLAFKRAAESLEKLMDATREELPDTMAAVRLSGMEISDLTMELSDLGREITQGVRNSSTAVRLAEDRLRSFSNLAPPPASLQTVANPKTEIGGPVLARNARGIRESIVKGRTFMQMFFTINYFSGMALDYFKRRAKRQ